MPGPARTLFPMLSVDDLDRSLAFYRELLGGEECFRYPDERPVFLTLRFGDAELGLGRLSDEPALHGEPLRPAQGHRVELCVYVDDVDATVARMREAGVPVLREPLDVPWGERIAYVRDPDGNLVMLTR